MHAQFYISTDCARSVLNFRGLIFDFFYIQLTFFAYKKQDLLSISKNKIHKNANDFYARSRGEVVTSPPLNRKVGCSRPTMIRARCLRLRQHYPAQKNNQKNSM